MKINYNEIYDVMKANPNKTFEDFYQEFATAYKEAHAKIEAEKKQLEIEKKKQARIEEAKTALIEAQIAYDIAVGRTKESDDLDKMREAIKTAIEIADKVDFKCKSKASKIAPKDDPFEELYKILR